MQELSARSKLGQETCDCKAIPPRVPTRRRCRDRAARRRTAESRRIAAAVGGSGSVKNLTVGEVILVVVDGTRSAPRDATRSSGACPCDTPVDFAPSALAIGTA